MATISKKKLALLSVATHLSGKLTNNFTTLSNYVYAGCAIFTLVNKITGVRFTYLITQKTLKDGTKTPHFVSILMGNDNMQNYYFVGTIFDKKTYVHSKKSNVSQNSPSIKGIQYVVNKLNRLQSLDDSMEVYHIGRCGKCGRALTEPESVATGIGPICGGVNRIKLTTGQTRKLKIGKLLEAK